MNTQKREIVETEYQSQSLDIPMKVIARMNREILHCGIPILDYQPL
jgi:hypothetical protein